MNENIKKIAFVVIVFIVGAAVGHFALPSKVVEKEHIVYQDRIVEKKVEVTAVQKKDHKTYIKIEHVAKDGSRVIETRIVNNSTEESVAKKTDETLEEKLVDTVKEKIVENSKQDLLISLGAKKSFSNLSSPLDYGVLIHKRILGPFYLGAFGFSDKSAGLDLGIAL
jgi:monomeric isocitrate dehydrogenase